MTEEPNPRMRLRGVVAGVTLTALLAGGGLSVAAAAQGSPSQDKAPSSQQENDHEGSDKPEATFTSSIKAPVTTEGKDGSEADEAARDKAEDAGLAKLATVTPEQATAAATKAVPGKAATPKLSNEDGNVVYEVTVTSADGKNHTEVIVDAGNAKVLHQEREDADHEGVDHKDGDHEGADHRHGGHETKDGNEKPDVAGTEAPAPTTGAPTGN